MSINERFMRIGHPRILVLGDLMLDRYTRGAANRTSQEAPVLVLRAEQREHRPGGAANVGLMLRVLETAVTCVGVVGEDLEGAAIRELLSQAGIDTQGVLSVANRPTTLKERFVGRSGSGLPSQILRVDTESDEPLDRDSQERLLVTMERLIPQQAALLISDYDKGVCTPTCLQRVIQLGRQHGVPILVDPGRGRDLNVYRGATLIKPNRHETELATGQRVRTPQDALRAGAALCAQYDFAMAVITLDADGMALVHRDGAGCLFPTRARTVFDITGAGDMVLSALGLGLAAGWNIEDAVHLANAAAGLEVDRTGVTPLTREEIRGELAPHASQSRRKVASLDQVARWAQEHRQRGRRVVLTNGCFDLLHVGHATYLEEAAELGDVLIVAINSDASVRRLKGPERPVIEQADRAAMLAALECVHHVLIFDEDTPHVLLDAIRPDVLVKGGTYAVDQVVGREVVEAYGGQVAVVGMVPGVSTTKIVHAVQDRQALRKAG